jgi:cyclopropane fatty-acyl-phospholipid synthase-like methyltransferase
MSRRHAPATARNRDAILAVLKRVLPAQGKVLEIASGTGEHVVHFAAALPGLTFQPSDLDEAALGSIAAWIAEAGLNNVQPPLRLDATQDVWPDTVDAIFSANMIHIAPWEAALGLFRGAGRALRSGGVLVIYGPFRMGGAHTAPSNQAFDEELRARDPRWGVRDLEMLQAVAAEHGLALEERVPMPANNQTLIFRRA